MSILNERSRRISSLLGRTLLNSARILMADMYLDIKTLVRANRRFQWIRCRDYLHLVFSRVNLQIQILRLNLQIQIRWVYLSTNTSGIFASLSYIVLLMSRNAFVK